MVNNLEDYVRISADVYYPEISFFYPDIKKDIRRNNPDKDGYYDGSLLQKKHG